LSRRHGRNTRFYVGIANASATAEPVPFLSKVDISFETDQQDVTAFGDTNHVYVGGLPDASGSVEGFWDDATPQLYSAAVDGSPRKFYLYPDIVNAAGVYWFGTGNFSFDLSSDVGAAIGISGNFNAASAVAKVG
jgi:hypothetical protein